MLRDRRYALLARCLVCTICGALLPILPVCVYFYSHGALSEMLYTVVTFNIKYKSGSIRPGTDIMRPVINAVRLSVCFIAPLIAFRHSRPLCIALAFVGLTVFLALLYTRGWCHYFLLESPLIVLTWYLLAGHKPWVQGTVTVGILCCFYSPSHSIVYPIRENCSILHGSEREWLSTRDNALERTVNLIPDSEIDSVYLIEGWDIATILNSRGASPVGRFFTGQAGPATFDPEIKATILSEFTNASPRWVISTIPFEHSLLAPHVYAYRLVATTPLGPHTIRLYRQHHAQ